MMGLFVQKHEQAVLQQGADVRVVYSDASGVYWWLDMFRQWRRLKRDWGMPDVVQMNVLDKNGVFAQWLYHRYHIPYIIIEHWSGYLPANFSFRGGWHGCLMRHIAKQAACILPVSQMLEDAMKVCGIQNACWQRIHNVVDDFFYTLDTKSRLASGGKMRFLHVSCFDERAKNVQGMLRAVKLVAEQRQDFEFVLVGNGVDYQRDLEYAYSLGLPEGILRFTGEQTPQEVASWMRDSDCFVMFSRYENAPVVLSECLAVGLPIISSNAGGIPEMINEGCGILVPSEDEEAMAQAMVYMMNHLEEYNPSVIRQHGKKYTYENVGAQLCKLYSSILNS
jgi:glycosyltransferase involved in cell wall biosynthesis